MLRVTCLDFCFSVQARDIIISPKMLKRTKRNYNVKNSPLSINDNDLDDCIAAHFP